MTRRVHIVGCRRSGTTLMMELLWYAYDFSGRAEHERSVFEPVPAGERLYLSKKPPDTIRLETVFRADVNLHLIALLRDPRSVMTSKHPSRPDVYFADYRRWREYVRALDMLKDHPRCLLVRYEDLILDPDGIQSQINQRFDFLRPVRAFKDFPQGANIPQAALNSLGGARPFDGSRITGWRDHLPRVKGQLALHPDLPEQLIATGYEPDDAWLSLLRDVQPHQQQYKDAGPGALRRFETRIRYAIKTQRYLRQLRNRPDDANSEHRPSHG